MHYTESNHEQNSDPPCDQDMYLAETSELDSILLSVPSPEPTPGTFEPATTKKLVCEQSGDSSCTKVRARLNEADIISFQFGDAECLVHTVESHSELLIPHSLQSQVLHLPH